MIGNTQTCTLFYLREYRFARDDSVLTASCPVGLVSFRPRVLSVSCLSTSCPVGLVSCRPRALSASCHVSLVSCRPRALSASCPVGLVSCWPRVCRLHVLSASCPVGLVSCRPRVCRLRVCRPRVRVPLAPDTALIELPTWTYICYRPLPIGHLPQLSMQGRI